MLSLVLMGASLGGCASGGAERSYNGSGQGSGGPTGGGPSGGSGAASSTGADGTTAGQSSTSLGSGGSQSVPLPMGTDPEALLPTRIRRLSNAEYDASTAALLGTSERLASSFAPDSRQSGYTVNDAQRVDAVLVKQLFSAAETLAAQARPNFAQLAPCDGGADPESCAQAFIDSFGAKAYRRPLESDEALGLLDVYRVGAEGASYEDGIELVIRALLQSAGFLYLTELGNGAPDANGVVTLTPHELASSLSYLITAGPPDQPLLDAALSGKLATPEGRTEQLLRLRQEMKAQSDERLVRVLREWISLDRIESTAKDSNIYPLFDQVKSAMVEESTSFIRTVLDESKGSVAELLGADWSITSNNDLIQLYGAQAQSGGRVSMPTRRGIINQGAFLSVHAHAHESTPVLRGLAIARRIACLSIPSPSSLNINVVPPVPDPNQTTRERFAVHSTDPECANCHSTIDAFGNAFEQFDGMGQYRETENSRPVDSTTVISVGVDFDGSYQDSNELAEALAQSPDVRSCFARQLFRAAVARSDNSITKAENAFVAEVEALPLEQQGNVIDALVTLVSGPLFTHRRTP